MPTFEAGDIVRVPFPYTDRDVRQRRPALVISDGALGQDGKLAWVLMITSAENRTWPGDVSLATNHSEAGLPSPSIVRTSKIATVETSRMDRIGRLPRPQLDAVRSQLGEALNLTP